MTEPHLTPLQLIAVDVCVRELRDKGQAPVWHWNACKCCVSVHDNVATDDVHYGYIVNRRGERFWEKVH
jgi:hypothetical protein